MLARFILIAAALALVVLAQDPSGSASSTVSGTNTASATASATAPSATAPGSPIATPACVQGCDSSALQASSCNDGDANCICGSDNYKQAFNDCLGGCSANDASVGQQQFSNLCQGISTTPPCVQGCEGNALQASSCNDGDMNCICNSATYKTTFNSCLPTACDTTDQGTGQMVLQQLCRIVAPPPPPNNATSAPGAPPGGNPVGQPTAPPCCGVPTDSGGVGPVPIPTDSGGSVGGPTAPPAGLPGGTVIPPQVGPSGTQTVSGVSGGVTPGAGNSAPILHLSESLAAFCTIAWTILVTF